MPLQQFRLQATVQFRGARPGGQDITPNGVAVALNGGVSKMATQVDVQADGGNGQEVRVGDSVAQRIRLAAGAAWSATGYIDLADIYVYAPAGSDVAHVQWMEEVL